MREEPEPVQMRAVDETRAFRAVPGIIGYGRRTVCQ